MLASSHGQRTSTGGSGVQRVVVSGPARSSHMLACTNDYSGPTPCGGRLPYLCNGTTVYLEVLLFCSVLLLFTFTYMPDIRSVAAIHGFDADQIGRANPLERFYRSARCV